MKKWSRQLVVALAVTLVPAVSQAEEIKIGVVSTFSGPFAMFGNQMKMGVEAFLEKNGNKVGDHTVSVIYRDIGGPKPDVAKQLASELIIKDGVKVLAGMAFTPNALAIGPVATQAKIPAVIFNAGTHFITCTSPMFVRTSLILDQAISKTTDWAAKNGVKKAVIAVSDYAPGAEAIKTYTADFEAKGGQIVDTVKIPLSTKDFSVYVQKIKDTKPDAVFTFVVNASPFVKTFSERGLFDDGIKLISINEFQEADLPQIGDAALGAISGMHYSAMHDSDLNRAFVDIVKKKNGQDIWPDQMAVGAYDGMHVIYEMIKRTNGKLGPEAVDAVKGLSWESPRGPISIDPKTRDIVNPIYIRRVVKENGILFNKEFATYPGVKDPWKEANPDCKPK